jgi:hypothetical protein
VAAASTVQPTTTRRNPDVNIRSRDPGKQHKTCTEILLGSPKVCSRGTLSNLRLRLVILVSDNYFLFSSHNWALDYPR